MSEYLAHKYGVGAENLAANYLQSNGYEILEKNYRTRFGEIDLIVRKQNTLVFVEVRARNTKEGIYDPLQMLSSRKIQKVMRAARVYLAKKFYSQSLDLSNELSELRFDFISVLGKSVNAHIKGWQV